MQLGVIKYYKKSLILLNLLSDCPGLFEVIQDFANIQFEINSQLISGISIANINFANIQFEINLQRIS